jgi:predicted nucleic acid-binding protein
MVCVIDSSFTASLFMPDEANAKSDALGKRIAADGATAPGLWQLEMTNLLLMAVRRKRLTPTERLQLLTAIDALPVTLHPVLNPQQRADVLHLAEKHGLTAYDATYLELALRTGLPLATLDDALRKSARAESVPVLP